jgi:hypothetical protein
VCLGIVTYYGWARAQGVMDGKIWRVDGGERGLGWCMIQDRESLVIPRW